MPKQKKPKKPQPEPEEITLEQALAILREESDALAARRARLNRDPSYLRRGAIEQFHELHGPECVVADGHVYFADGSYRENSHYGVLHDSEHMKPLDLAWGRVVYARLRWEEARQRYYDRRDFMIESARAAQALKSDVPPAELVPDEALAELEALKRKARPLRAVLKRAEQVHQTLKDQAQPKVRQMRARDDHMRSRHAAVADALVKDSLENDL